MPDTSLQSLARQGADAMRRAKYAVVVTGAGMSADSGIPTYRDEGGFWRQHKLLEQAGIQSENGVSPRLLKEAPDAFWALMQGKKALFDQAQPHNGYLLLGTWFSIFQTPYFIATSNVDGMFQKTGFPEERIWELHGSLSFGQCSKPCSGKVWPAAPVPGVCPECGATTRPAILFFNDLEWAQSRHDRQLVRYQDFLRENTRGPGVVFEIGVGRRIPRSNELSEELWRRGATVIRINPEAPRSDQPGVIHLQTGALAGLEGIDIALRSWREWHK